MTAKGVKPIDASQAVSYSTSITLGEFIARGLITAKTADLFEARVNELIDALYDGKALERQPNGVFKIVDAPPKASDLVLGDDDE